jgi:cell division inhibitor SulA
MSRNEIREVVLSWFANLTDIQRERLVNAVKNALDNGCSVTFVREDDQSARLVLRVESRDE